MVSMFFNILHYNVYIHIGLKYTIKIYNKFRKHLIWDKNSSVLIYFFHLLIISIHIYIYFSQALLQVIHLLIISIHIYIYFSQALLQVDWAF